jgi:hypothetical protein
MKKLLAMVIGFGMLLALSGPALSETKSKDSKKPNIVVTEAYEVTATVEKIDQATRMLTLKGPAGNLIEVVVDKSVKNFAQIKPGDEVVVKYLESVGISVRSSKDAPSEASLEIAKVAPPGEKPAGYDVQVKQITATVESINYLSRTVSLKGPQGNVLSFKVDKNVKNFWHVKKGDQVVVDYVEAVAISVEKPVKK